MDWATAESTFDSVGSGTTEEKMLAEIPLLWRLERVGVRMPRFRRCESVTTRGRCKPREERRGAIRREEEPSSRRMFLVVEKSILLGLTLFSMGKC